MADIRELVTIGWRNADRTTWDTEAREWLTSLAEVSIDALDNPKVAAAYGGMRFRTTGPDNPVPGTVGTTPEKITLYDEEMPLFGDPVNLSFDAATDEVVVDQDQGGVYEVSLFLNFVGEQGEVYTVAIYLDSGSGPTPIGSEIYVRVSNQDNTAEIQLSTIARINGDSRWSVWINADKANTTFNVFGTSLYFTRVSPILEDQ